MYFFTLISITLHTFSFSIELVIKKVRGRKCIPHFIFGHFVVAKPILCSTITLFAIESKITTRWFFRGGRGLKFPFFIINIRCFPNRISILKNFFCQIAMCIIFFTEFYIHCIPCYIISLAMIRHDPLQIQISLFFFRFFLSRCSWHSLDLGPSISNFRNAQNNTFFPINEPKTFGIVSGSKLDQIRRTQANIISTFSDNCIGVPGLRTCTSTFFPIWQIWQRVKRHIIKIIRHILPSSISCSKGYYLLQI